MTSQTMVFGLFLGYAIGAAVHHMVGKRVRATFKGKVTRAALDATGHPPSVDGGALHRPPVRSSGVGVHCRPHHRRRLALRGMGYPMMYDADAEEVMRW